MTQALKRLSFTFQTIINYTFALFVLKKVIQRIKVRQYTSLISILLAACAPQIQKKGYIESPIMPLPDVSLRLLLLGLGHPLHLPPLDSNNQVGQINM